MIISNRHLLVQTVEKGGNSEANTSTCSEENPAAAAIDGIAPPSDVDRFADASAAESDTSNLVADRLRDAIIRFGRGLLSGEPMVSLFEFVRRLRSMMGPRWPEISHEQACAILKENLHQWTSDLQIHAPVTPCHVMTGWIRTCDDGAAPSENYLG